jgi:hypothetical protein
MACKCANCSGCQKPKIWVEGIELLVENVLNDGNYLVINPATGVKGIVLKSQLD